MLEYFIVAALGIVVVSAIILISIKRSKAIGQPYAPPNALDRSYFPGIPGSSKWPLPVRGRTERKKTETFQQHSDN